MTTRLSSFAFALLFVPLAIVLPGETVAAPATTVVTPHVADDGTTYYSVSLSLPPGLASVTHAWLELRADVSAKDLSGFQDPAPVLDVYGLNQALARDPEPSMFDATRIPMSRPVAVGVNRLIKINITEFVEKIFADPSKNHGIVLGPLTADKRGIFGVKQDGFGPGVAARIQIVE